MNMDAPIQPQGAYFDGRTAQRWPVEVKLKPDVLLFRVIGEMIVHAWPIADIQFEFDPKQSPPVIRGYKDGQRVDIADAKYISILRRTKPAHLKKKFFWNELDAKDTLKWIACALVSIVAIYFAWPHFADAVAPIVPEKYLAATGKREVEFIAKRGKQCTDVEGQRVLDGIVARLSGGQDGVSVKMYNSDEINAYAIPLNNIAVMDGLIQHLSSGDELVAVLAHETGHLQAKHASRLIARNMGASLLAQLVGFDQSLMLLDQSYSRDMEREADSLGLAMMQRANISPAIMVDLFQEFEKMERKDGKESPLNFKFLNFFASHPVTSEREAMAQKAAATYTNAREPVLTAGEWQSLRSMCDDEKLKKSKRSAELGDARAQSAMAARYLSGKGVPADRAEAFRLATEAANGGDANGQFLLGVMYLDSIGTAYDSEQAYKLMLKSAEQGNVDAQVNVGVMYRFGVGIAANPVEAHHWSQKAANQKSTLTEDKVTAGIAKAELGAAVALQYSAVKKPEDAFLHATKAASMGNAQAQLLLSSFYMNGEGTAKDPALAFSWALKSANQNYGIAQQAVSTMYQRGEGTPRDDAAAANWGQKARDNEKQSMKAAVDLASTLNAPVVTMTAVQNQTAPPSAPDPAYTPPAPPVAISLNSAAAIAGDPHLDQPVDARLVMVWASVSAPKVLSFSYQDYPQKRAVAEGLFSPDGWTGFSKAMNEAHLVDAITARKLTSSLTLQAVPEITRRGIEDGVYTWDVQMPVQLSFAGEAPPAPIKSMLLLHLVRVTPSDGGVGVAIQKWVTNPM
jgi:TPR repeat protein